MKGFEDYKIKLNARAMCIFEQIADKSFFECGSDDILQLMYACFVANNRDMHISFNTFLLMCEDGKVAKWLMKEYKRINEYNAQLAFERKALKTDNDTSDNAEVKVRRVTDIAAELIINFGMDAHYVMDEMEMWELEPLFNAAEEKKKTELTLDRLWTYLTILPQVDGRKLKSPEKLIRFSWEEDAANKDLKIHNKDFFEKDNKPTLAQLIHRNGTE